MCRRATNALVFLRGDQLVSFFDGVRYAKWAYQSAASSHGLLVRVSFYYQGCFLQGGAYLDVRVLDYGGLLGFVSYGYLVSYSAYAYILATAIASVSTSYQR